ncbi:hypothetical protein NE237_017551 [Protea cynaroides]|uniref:Uncharacterized protein n=1 Tax=Protea cynaroides TaxID=273540 RepID=A0A9Q0K892_9MAGN|nr:hypothetical protein NE237_017551 [Protea cynaroides]
MPDFSRIPNLEKLILHSCGNLVEIPESIGHLSKLVELDLKNCWRLENLPIGISKLTSLEKLIISGCKIKRLPEGIGNLTRLTVLGAEYTTIEPLPDDEHEENIQLNGGYKLTIGCVKERIFEVTSEEFQNSKICDIYLPWSKIGEWLDIQEKTVSASCQFAQLPNMEIERVKIGEWLNIREKRVSSSRQFEQLPNAEIEGVIICILCRTNTYSSFLRNNSVAVLLHNQSKDCTWYHIVKYKTKQFNEDSIWVIKIPHCIWKSIADGGDIISVSVETDDRKYISIEIDIHMCYTMRGRHSHGMGSGLSEEYQMSYDRSESNCRSIVSLEVPLWDDDGSEGIPHQHDDVSNSNEQSHSPNNCLCFRWSCLRSKSDG